MCLCVCLAGGYIADVDVMLSEGVMPQEYLPTCRQLLEELGWLYKGEVAGGPNVHEMYFTWKSTCDATLEQTNKI